MGEQYSHSDTSRINVVVHTTDEDLVERLRPAVGDHALSPTASLQELRKFLVYHDLTIGIIIIDLHTFSEEDVQDVIPKINTIPNVLVVLLSSDGQGKLSASSNLRVRYCRLKRDFPADKGAKLMDTILRLYWGSEAAGGGKKAGGEGMGDVPAESRGRPVLKYTLVVLLLAALIVPSAYFFLQQWHPGSDDAKRTDDPAAADEDKAAKESAVSEQVNVDSLREQSRSLIARADAAIQVGEYFEPEKISAFHYYSRALELDPEDEELNNAISDFIDDALPDINEKLENHRLMAASERVKKLRQLQPDDPRLSEFDERLKEQINDTIAEAREIAAQGDEEKARSMLEEAAGVLAIDLSVLTELHIDNLKRANEQERIEELSSLAIQRLEEGKLLAPPQDNAKHYLYSLKNMDPENETVRLGYKELGRLLLRQADKSIEQNELKSAEKWLEEARLLDVLEEEVAATTAALNEAVQKERQRVAAEKRETRIQTLLENLQAQLGDGKLLQPEEDNARHTLGLLREEAPEDPRTADATTEYHDRVIALAGEALEADRYQRVESLLQSVEDVSPAPGEAQSRSIADLRDRLAARQKENQAGEEEDRPKPVKLVQSVQPDYPSRALRRNIQGWVHLEFDISAEGTTQNIAVVEAEPEGIFENAAIEAVEGFEYEAVDTAGADDFPYREEIMLRFKLE